MLHDQLTLKATRASFDRMSPSEYYKQAMKSVRVILNIRVDNGKIAIAVPL